MLSKEEITLVVTVAMSRYAAKNGGKRGLARDAVIDAVAQFEGDIDDVRMAMIEGIKRFAT